MATTVPSLLVSTERRFCRHCARIVLTKPRARFASLGITASVALTLALIAFSSLIGPFIMFTVPFILLAGFAIGPLVALASEPPTCSVCHRELAVHAAPARTPARASAAVGDMKAA